MKGKALALLLALGVAGQASAQEPVPNLGQALGNLVPNLTTTADALLAAEVTGATLALGGTVGDLQQDLLPGTPLASSNVVGDSLSLFSGLGPGTVDRFLAGDLSVDELMTMTQVLGIRRMIETGNYFDSTSPFMITVNLILNMLGNSDAIFGAGADGLTGLDPSILTGMLGGAGGDAALPLDLLQPATVLDLAAAGDAGAGLPVGDLPLPLDALDPGTLTALLGGGTLPGL